MFYLAGNDMIAFDAVRLGHTDDGMVVGLGTAAGKNDFVRPAIDQ